MFDSIEITTIPTLEKGAQHQCEVLGKKSGDPDVDITLSCIFSVADVSIATINDKGKCTAQNGGQTQLRAKYGATEVTAGVGVEVPYDPEAPETANPDIQQINKRLNFFEVAMCVLGAVEADQLLFQFIAGHPFTLPIDLAGSKACARVAAAADPVVIELFKNDVKFGEVTYAASALTGTFAAEEATAFVPGDILTMVVADTDTTFETPSVSLYGEPDAK